MSKKAKTALVIKDKISLAARQMAAMEKNAREVDADENERREHRLQLLSSPAGLQAVIKNDRFTLQIDGDTFAVTSRD
jgi:hypothetical protein